MGLTRSGTFENLFPHFLQEKVPEVVLGYLVDGLRWKRLVLTCDEGLGKLMKEKGPALTLEQLREWFRLQRQRKGNTHSRLLKRKGLLLMRKASLQSIRSAQSVDDLQRALLHVPDRYLPAIIVLTFRAVDLSSASYR